MQTEALKSVLQKGDTPAGFDAGQMWRTANVLAGKRRREAAVFIPRAAEKLGDKYIHLFDGYAAKQGYPPHGGPAEDAAGFLRFLIKSHDLPGAAIWEALMVMARRGSRVQLHWLMGCLYVSVRRGSRVQVWRVFAIAPRGVGK
jgi:hypothetical protein